MLVNFLMCQTYRIKWEVIGVVQRLFKDFPSTCFQQVESVLGQMWNIIVLDHHYPYQELPKGLFYDLFYLQQCVAIPRRNCITGLCADLKDCKIAQTNFPQVRKQKRRYSLLL